jgi:hypothetical protein
MWGKTRERGAPAPHLYFPESSGKSTKIPEALELSGETRSVQLGKGLAISHISRYDWDIKERSINENAEKDGSDVQQ